MATRTYTLTKTMLKKFKSKGYALVCYGCGKVLKPGDVVVSRIRPRALVQSETVRYHKRCWNKTFVA